ncbi:hypothetical protein OAK85_03875, partial [Mariniblastus sp.]|nr:hypothetical protein [Mariniblastus sp.]
RECFVSLLSQSFELFYKEFNGHFGSRQFACLKIGRNCKLKSHHSLSDRPTVIRRLALEQENDFAWSALPQIQGSNHAKFSQKLVISAWLIS